MALIIQLLLHVGTSPAKWQWCAMFGAATAVVLLGTACSVSLFTTYWGTLSGPQYVHRTAGAVEDGPSCKKAVQRLSRDVSGGGRLLEGTAGSGSAPAAQTADGCVMIPNEGIQEVDLRQPLTPAGSHRPNAAAGDSHRSADDAADGFLPFAMDVPWSSAYDDDDRPGSAGASSSSSDSGEEMYQLRDFPSLLRTPGALQGLTWASNACAGQTPCTHGQLHAVSSRAKPTRQEKLFMP